MQCHHLQARQTHGQTFQDRGASSLHHPAGVGEGIQGAGQEGVGALGEGVGEGVGMGLE